MPLIRSYDAARDAASLRRCFIVLQEVERELQPALPGGEEVADAYLARMLARCSEWAGEVFVAEEEGEVVGFVCVWGAVPQEEVDEVPGPFAFVSDLVVLPEHRGRGIGRRLLARAERHARQRGAALLKLAVLAENTAARRLYEELGYAEHEVVLAKPLN